MTNQTQQQSNIGAVELFTFTYCGTIAMGLVFLPYISSLEIRTAWLKIVVAVIPYCLLLFLYKKVVDKHRTRDILQLFQSLSYKAIYYFVLLFILAGAMYSLLFITKSLIIIVQTFLMQDTSQWLLGTAYVIVVMLSVFYGINAVSRMTVIIFFHEILLFIALFSLLFSEDFRWINVAPVFGVDMLTFLRSTISELAQYGGLVVLLAFLPHVKKEVKVFKPIAISLLFIVFTYFLVCLVPLGVFGFDQTLTLLSPLTSLMQSVPSETGLFERLDLFFLTVWIMSFYKIGLIFVWFCATLLRTIVPVKQKQEWIHVAVVSIINYIIVLITPSITNLPWEPYNFCTIIYSLVVPLLLFVYLLMRKKKQGASQ